MTTMMKKIASIIAAAALSISALAQVPYPVEFNKADGTPNTTTELSKAIGKRAFAKKTAALPAFAREEAYALTLTPKGYKVEANTELGYLRAKQTLAQMESCGSVYDYPRFPYRGFMLDISRHFRDKDFIIKQMEALATLKINRLHLHLTDDAGWRLQIERYPLLTSQAAWRVGATWAQWGEKGRLYAQEGTPEASGGYLTKADVKEILSAAERLGMVVVPEIEMPGHSREVIFAYPELGCKPGSEEFCPGKEESFTFIENVLAEVIELFPSEYIHIGGDEASKKDWADCPDCKARMQAEGLKDVEELQSYLVRRVERYLNSKGRHLLGWDEILEGGLSPHATVMSWRGTEGGIEAMKQGHDAIMTPGKYCYINNAQDAPIFEPHGQGGYLPLELVYSYNPLQGIPEQLHPLLLGMQANLWHEHIPTPEHTEYMMYPRIAALAERAWSPAAREDYRERIDKWNEALAAKGYNVFHLNQEFGERPESIDGVKHLALGKKVTYAKKWSKSYPAAGESTLTDGLCGGWSYGDGRWQGFLTDIDVTIDLEKVEDIHFVGGTFLGEPGPDIWLPESIEVWVSTDDIAYKKAGTTALQIKQQSPSYVLLGLPLQEQARYVRFVSHRTAGFQFLDEIIIN